MGAGLLLSVPRKTSRSHQEKKVNNGRRRTRTEDGRRTTDDDGRTTDGYDGRRPRTTDDDGRRTSTDVFELSFINHRKSSTH